ncbi:MAG: HNH endonuclease [Chromatiales bacterium]|nr:HNH endonuclease [Chromatiales bacterium]
MEVEDPASSACRAAAFQWLRHQSDAQGDVLPRSMLATGFPYQGGFVRLVGPQGIFKPMQIRRYPLSITTTSQGPYQDAFEPEGKYLLYSYRGSDPNHHENRGLRDAMRDRIPLIYFHSTVPGHYLAVWPVFIIHDNPGQLMFTVAVDDPFQLGRSADDADEEIRRGYVTRLVRQRIHQRTFRDRVLMAYREQCAICRLRHTSLLDAAHIVADSSPEGEPVVSNGLSLCKLHHAAYDRLYFSVRPDYRVEVRPEIMEERDGPMLLHGLQNIHEIKIQVPTRVRDQPDPRLLGIRHDVFMSERESRGA